MMETLFTDLRYAVRQLRKAPVLSAAGVMTLAIGLGATTAIFATVNATLLRPLPFPRSNELVDVRTRMTDGRVTSGRLSAMEIRALNDAQTAVAGAAGLSARPLDVTLLRDDGTPVNIILTGVTEGFFGVLGLPMVHGRVFSHEEHVVSGRDAPLAVVVSYPAWKRLFAGDPGVIGKSIRIAEAPVTAMVVGVAPADLDLPRGTDFWFNIRTNPLDVSHNFETILRLRPGVSLDQLRGTAAAAMTGLAQTTPSDVGREFVIQPLTWSLVGDLGPMLLIALGATALLLVLACVNVTNLLLARVSARTREFALRTAVGAGRFRLIRQLLTESLVLATAGAISGIAIAYIGLRVLLPLGASKLPQLESVPLDGRVLAFALIVLVATGVVLGLVPALRLADNSISGSLNETGRGFTSNRAASRLMGLMIVAEVALALALVAGAGWLVQSFARLRTTDPGFASSQRLVMEVRPTRRFREPAQVLAWSDALLSRVRDAVAGHGVVGAASTFPLRGDRDRTVNVKLRGEPDDPTYPRGGHARVVTPGFFEAMQIKLLAGRTFIADDLKDTQPVVVVNRAFVRTFFADTDPLNREIAYGYPTIDATRMSRIVGVVEDVHYKSLAESPEPTFYLPLAQAAAPFTRHVVVVAAQGDAQALVSPLRMALRQFDPQMSVSFTTASAIVDDTMVRQQLGMTLMATFGLTALVLAAIGIYGVTAYAAGQRTREIATRIALGATGQRVFWLMLVAGQRLAVIGLVLGLLVAYVGGRAAAGSVFGMRASDPFVLIAALVIVGGVTLVANLVPAVRASRLDPVPALRAE